MLDISVYRADTGQEIPITVRSQDTVGDLLSKLTVDGGSPQYNQQALLLENGVHLDEQGSLSQYWDQLQRGAVFLFDRNTLRAQVSPTTSTSISTPSSSSAAGLTPVLERVREDLIHVRQRVRYAGQSAESKHPLSSLRPSSAVEEELGSLLHRATTQAAEVSAFRLEGFRVMHEQRRQLIALAAATSSLMLHTRPLVDDFNRLHQHYEQQRARHTAMLSSFESDLRRLREVPVPAQLLRGGSPSSSSSSSSSSPSSSPLSSTSSFVSTSTPTTPTTAGSCSLYDCVSAERLREWAADCRTRHQQLAGKVTRIEQAISDLQAGSHQENVEEPKFNRTDLAAWRTELTELEKLTVKLVDEAWARSSHMSVHGVGAQDAPQRNWPRTDDRGLEEWVIQVRQTLDRTRSRCDELLGLVLESKHRFSDHLHARLRNISALQVRARRLRERLIIFREDLVSQKNLFHQLAIVKGMPTAFRAAQEEAARRRQWSDQLNQTGEQLNNALTRLRTQETHHRTQFMKTFGDFLPEPVLASLMQPLPTFSVKLPPLDRDLLDLGTSPLSRSELMSAWSSVTKVLGVLDRLQISTESSAKVHTPASAAGSSSSSSSSVESDAEQRRRHYLSQILALREEIVVLKSNLMREREQRVSLEQTKSHDSEESMRWERARVELEQRLHRVEADAHSAAQRAQLAEKQHQEQLEKLAQAQDDAQTARELLARLQAEGSASTVEQRAQIVQLQAELEQARLTTAQRRKELEQARALAHEQEQQCTQLVTRCSELETELAEAREVSTSTESAAESAFAKLEEMRAHCAQLEQRIDELMGAQTDARLVAEHREQELNDQVAQLHAELAESTRATVGVRERLQQLEEQLAEQQLAASGTMDDAQLARARLEQERKSVLDLRAEMSATEADLHARIARLQQERDQSSNSYQSVSRLANTLVTKAEGLERRLEKAKQRISDLETELEKAQTSLRACEATKAEAVSRSEAEHTALMEVRAELEKSTITANSLEVQLADVTADKNTLQVRLSQLEAEIGEHENAGAELKSRVMELMDQLQQREQYPERPMIAVSDFKPHDWVMFLPNTDKHYEAYNLDSPNYYLAPESVAACKTEVERKQMIVGEVIAVMDEVARSGHNPYKLLNGTAYHTLLVIKK